MADVVRIENFESFVEKIRNCQDENKKSDQKTPVELSSEEQYKKKSAVFVYLASIAAYLVRYLNILFFSTGVFFFLCKNHKSIDILHVHTADWIAGLATFSGRIFRIPVICKGANMPVFPPLSGVPLAWFFEKWRKRPYFIALTEAMRENLIENGVNHETISVIPNGVLTVTSTVAVENNRNFLYIGNFSQTAAHKAFDILIQAWAEVNRKRPDARLIMVGGGDIAPWQEYARKCNCADSIQFAGYQNDIIPFIQTSCCLLLPSRKEGISNALLEAQSYGLPAIVSDIPGNTEIVTNRKNGIVVPVADVVALANAIVEVADDAKLRKILGAEAKQMIEERFSMKRVAQSIYTQYCKLTTGDSE
jgi:glycosyltransferase involved in cell wall biosynthesis